MQLLKDIDDARAAADGAARAAEGLRPVLEASLRTLEDLQGEARRLESLIAAAGGRIYPVTTAKGPAVDVSERDALQLFAALVVCLSRRPASAHLGGQQVEIMVTDLEQLAAQILAQGPGQGG